MLSIFIVWLSWNSHMYKSFVPVPVGPQWGICPTFGSSGLYPYGDNLEKELQMNYVVLEAQPSCISLKIALKFDKEICIYLIFNLFVLLLQIALFHFAWRATITQWRKRMKNWEYWALYEEVGMFWRAEEIHNMSMPLKIQGDMKKKALPSVLILSSYQKIEFTNPYL